MKKIFYFFLIIACLFTLPSCAQSKPPLAKVYGFYVIPIPGTIRVDESGRPVDKRDTVFNVYIETKASDIHWHRAWKNGRSFAVTAFPVNAAKAVVGESRAGQRKIELSAQKGSALWQLELSDDTKHEKAPQRLLGSEVLLKGQWKNKTFYYKIKSLTELASPQYQ